MTPFPFPLRAVVLSSSPKAARSSKTTVDCLCAFELFRLGAVGYLSILCRFRHYYPSRAAGARLIGSATVRWSRLLGLDAGHRGVQESACQPPHGAMDAKIANTTLPRCAKKDSLNPLIGDVSLVWCVRKPPIAF